MRLLEQEFSPLCEGQVHIASVPSDLTVAIVQTQYQLPMLVQHATARPLVSTVYVSLRRLTEQTGE